MLRHPWDRRNCNSCTYIRQRCIDSFDREFHDYARKSNRRTPPVIASAVPLYHSEQASRWPKSRSWFPTMACGGRLPDRRTSVCRGRVHNRGIPARDTSPNICRVRTRNDIQRIAAARCGPGAPHPKRNLSCRLASVSLTASLVRRIAAGLAWWPLASPSLGLPALRIQFCQVRSQLHLVAFCPDFDTQ